MKARIYAAAVGGRRQWHVTLNMDIDCVYWFEQYGGKASLHLLEPVLSLAEAFARRTEWNDKGKAEWVGVQNSEWGEKEKLLVPLAAAGAMQGGKPPNRREAEAMASLRTISYADYDARKATEPAWHTQPQLAELQEMESLLAGRCLSKEELLQLLQHHGLEHARSLWTSYVQASYLRGRLRLQHSIERAWARKFPWSRPERRDRCLRCGSGNEHMYRADCLYCAGECVYCEACLTMGRLQSCSPLLFGSAEEERRAANTGVETRGDFIKKWGLSPAQTEAARSGLAYLRERAVAVASGKGGSREKVRDDGNNVPRDSDAEGPAWQSPQNKESAAPATPGRFLIWAVTGAGKTEMIFPFIDYVLEAGKKALIATPRRDVVLELAPRLAKAFPQRSIVTLYGGSEQRWERGDITLSTTHQLLRFQRCFDLVIVDEIDAFPYHNNPMLQFAAERVCKPSGVYVLLSATPPASLIRAAARNALAHVKVPVRYHRHPLPVPQRLAIRPIAKWGGALPGAIRSALRRSVDRGALQFVFVPRIRDVDTVVQAIRPHFADCTVEGTSSQDPLRAEKVTRFRQRDIRILVTTTILERGVTVPKTDVFILQADSATFDSAALVQMAGRAGRSPDDPRGSVIFAAAEHTNAQSAAIRQIRQMNRLAKRKGYLVGSRKDRAAVHKEGGGTT